MTRAQPLLLASCALVLAACDPSDSAIDLERMIVQEYAKPYRASSYFADGRVLQQPPAGTVARDRIVDDPILTEGIQNDIYAERIPIPISRATLDRGRGQFETFCAACHGVLGDGQSVPADFMTFRKPPALVSPPVRDYPPGRIYRAIHQGYGLMPSYAWMLSVEDRWAIVAYLQALALSQGVALDALPPAVREQAERTLP
jgi:cytochrome c553